MKIWGYVGWILVSFAISNSGSINAAMPATSVSCQCLCSVVCVSQALERVHITHWYKICIISELVYLYLSIFWIIAIHVHTHAGKSAYDTHTPRSANVPWHCLHFISVVKLIRVELYIPSKGSFCTHIVLELCHLILKSYICVGHPLPNMETIIAKEKKEIWLGPMSEESSTSNWQHKHATKNFDYTTIADRIWTVNWSNNSQLTGVVNPVY